ncbi:MAG: hypothetical protein ACR2KT_14885 [Methylocella sp.]|nr:MAG: hypothetical protein DLM68_05855 [Hyphomicrobiales bacterium]
MAWSNPSFTRWLGGPERAIVEDGLTLSVHKMARVVSGAGSVRAGSWIWKIGDETHATMPADRPWRC